MKALLHLLRTALNDRDELEGMPNGFVDDASRLNRTRVSEVRSVAGLLRYTYNKRESSTLSC
jgi:hypothetical protein